MARKLSRLQRVRKKREARQGVLYLITAIVFLILIIFWGVPALANWASLFFESDEESAVVGDFDLKPTPPVIFDVPESTPSASIDIEGYAQSGVEVVLYLNNREYEKKLTDDTGTFKFTDVELDSGENFVYALSVAQSGKESEKSKSYTIILDNIPPELEITSPEDGAELLGESERLVTISGVATDAISVFVDGRKAILNAQGVFSIRHQLDEGRNEILVSAIDRAGNESEATLNLVWRP